MNKKISILLFFLFVLISMSAVSAVDADGNNDTIVSSADAGTLALANDVDAIDDLDGNYSDGDTKALSSDAKSVAVGKNEIYGATYEEAEGDSMSPVLGQGDYYIDINFDPVYQPMSTNFNAMIMDMMGQEQPIGTLYIWVDDVDMGSFTVDDMSISGEIASVDAGSHSWYAEFTPDGSSEKSTESGSFTIDQHFANVYIDDPGQSSIEMGVGESRNFRGHVDGPESSEVNISSSNDNVAKFRASSSFSYGFEGYIDAVGAGTATITVSFAGNTNYKAAESKTLTVTVIVPSKTIYVNATANQGGDGNQTTPFQTLQDALDIAEDGDTIMIAAGEYKGTDNTGLSISKNLNFVKYGDGEAIFDAEGQGRIWSFMIMPANITGLTFKNGISTSSDGGAIYMSGGNVINCNFIGNNATSTSNSVGGAIYCSFYTNVTNCTFTDNAASYMGGAIYFFREGSVSDCTFAGNTAKWGGAIRFDNMDNVDDTMTNCAFVNNSAQYGKVISSSGALKSVDNNWWGSNNPDWNELINQGGIPSSYAVLNVTTDKQSMVPGSKAKLNYAFYRNGTTEILSLPERAITLSATDGDLDNTSGYLVNGEFSTEFSADEVGEYEITAMVDNQEVKINVTVAIPTWYVNASKTSSGDGKSEEAAFMTLKEAIDAAGDGDIIMIASGTYTGENNTDLTINNNLTFEKYGEGEAIFDAQELSRIWTVTAATINITGLTFKNGKITANSEGGGAAIYIENVLSNSIINASFINNVVVGSNVFGGAILFEKAVDNVEIYGEFINNTVDLTSYSYGGAISFKDAVSNSIINATFADNSANKFGGAIYFDANKNVNNIKIYGEFNNNKANSEGRGGAISFREDVSNSIINALFINNAVVGSNIFGGAIYFQAPINNLDITGKFINNTGKDVIYIGSAGSGNEIHDAVFLNNAANNIINIGSGSVYASDNWFGNNATNYNETPANVGIDLDNWLFLNATAGPKEIGIDESSTITFKLFSYDGSDIDNYTGPIDIQLDLTQTLGELNKDVASLGEEITYTAKQAGDGSVTARFETASYTINFDLDPRTPTEINVTNSTLDLKVNEEVAAGATLTPADAGNLTYTSSNSSVAIVENGKIKALKEGNAVITVSFAGDDQYRAAENKTITVTVTLRDAKWTYIGFSGVEEELDDASLYLPLNYAPDCFVKDADGIALPAGTNITIFCEGNNNYTITTTTQENGLFNVDVSNVEPYQVYKVSFTAEGYTAATARVYVIKAPTTIDVANNTVDMKVKEEIATGASLNPSGAGNLTYTSSDESVAVVEDGMIKALGAGTATITVSFAGDGTYAAAEDKNITVTVTKSDLTLTIPEIAVYNSTNKLVAILKDVEGNPVSDFKVKLVAGELSRIGRTDANGEISMDVSSLEPGRYTVGARSQITDAYNEAKVYAVGYVKEGKVDATLTIPDVIVIGDTTGATVVATLKDEFDNILKGVKVKIVVGSLSKLARTNANGQVSMDISSLGLGAYKIAARSQITDVFNEAKAKAKAIFSEDKLDTTLTVSDVFTVYNSTQGFAVATLKDSYGNAVSGVKVNLTVGNLSSVVETDVNGQVSLDISSLEIGGYDISAVSEETDLYKGATAAAIAVVSADKITPTMTIPDVEIQQGDEGAVAVATLTDEFSNVITGLKVKIVVGTLSKIARTDANGQVSLDISSLAPGEYQIAARSAITDVFNEAKAKARATIK